MGNKTSLDAQDLSTQSLTTNTSLRTVHFTDLNFSEVVVSNKENITLIWLDENINRHHNKTTKIEDLLKQINNYLLLCTDRDTCIRCINVIQNEKIVLLISGSCSDDVLSNVHNLQQLDSVFIFCMKPERYTALKTKYSKIVGIYVHQNDLIDELSEVIFALSKQITAFNLFYQNNETFTNDLTKESAGYIWSQLIKDILVNKSNINVEISKQDMIKKCRDYYRYNKYQLKNIDYFEQKYQPSDAIYWYTKPSSFISCLISKALRIKDIDLLYLFRFFLIDLSTQLKNIASTYSTSVKDTSHSIYLYRGLKLTTEELLKLEENIGNLISTSGFLSTSRKQEVALTFAINVLFEIETDVSLQEKTWSDIAQYSAIPDEEEVLFDIGTSFRIQSISYDSQLKLWRVHLKTTENINVTNYLQGSNVEVFFGELYYYMGNYEKSKRYLNGLFERLKSDDQSNNISTSTDFDKLKQIYDNKIKNKLDKHLLDDVSTLVVIAEAYQQNRDQERANIVMKKALDLLSKY